MSKTWKFVLALAVGAALTGLSFYLTTSTFSSRNSGPLSFLTWGSDVTSLDEPALGSTGFLKLVCNHVSATKGQGLPFVYYASNTASCSGNFTAYFPIALLLDFAIWSGLAWLGITAYLKRQKK
jgi:hypothetical protein